jgi:hypothetical protein
MRTTGFTLAALAMLLVLSPGIAAERKGATEQSTGGTGFFGLFDNFTPKSSNARHRSTMTAPSRESGPPLSPDTTSYVLPSDVAPNDIALFLAGKPPSETSPLYPLTKDAAWRHHSETFGKSWSELDARQLSKIKAWSTRALPERQPVVFYMFSGPDFLYADALLPDADTYVLSGLEPVGHIPSAKTLANGHLSSHLAALEHSLGTLLSFSFFRTKDMKVTLHSQVLDGTLPDLLVFLARSDQTVEDITYVGLTSDGTLLTTIDPKSPPATRGIRVGFSAPGRTKPRTLYYFSTNLSDDGVKSSGFLAFCLTLGKGDSLVKSASYLMHQPHFSKVREFLLANSATIVQDDSGIPVSYLNTAGWRLQPYGTYLGPISIFPNRYQNGLRAIFAKSREPLEFGIGYRWHPKESNLLIAQRAK